MQITKIVSGGQTGADRAALDAALALDVDHGGWVPKGRLAEDGPLSDIYRVDQTPSGENSQRTEWNVRDSDGTLILAIGPLGGGTALTEQFAKIWKKPYLTLDPSVIDHERVILEIRTWLRTLPGGILNVAGPRASEQPEIYRYVYKIMKCILARNRGV